VTDPVFEDLGRPRRGDGVGRSADGRIVATYVVQGVPDLAATAEELVLEESTGTRTAAADVVERVGGAVLSIEDAGCRPLASVSAPLAKAGISEAPAGRVTVAWPAANATSLPALLTMVVGEATERGTFGACRLVRLDLPDELLAVYGGPNFGAAGLAEEFRSTGPPLLGAIVKPSTGMTPEQVAHVAAELARGGADFVKDDELLTDPGYCRFEDRVRAVRAALAAVESETGRSVAYAVNATGPVDTLPQRLQLARESGCAMVMLNVLAVGFDVLRWVAEQARVPVFAHRVLGGALTRSAAVGLSPPVLCGLTRLAGADLVQVGGVAGRIFEDDETIALNADACSRPLTRIQAALPVSGGGQGLGTVEANAALFRADPFCHLLGSVATDDPDGPRRGVEKVRAKWEHTEWKETP